MSSRRPTLDTAAREVGVSRATASNAYNRPDQLSERLRTQILSATQRLGYSGPDPVARSLAMQRSGAVAVMLDLRHRDIGILSLELDSDGRSGPVSPLRMGSAQLQVTTERLNGYLGELPVTPPIWEAPDSRREQGREGAKWLLAQDPRPTALLCMSDELAVGAIRAAREIGLSVPTDLTIVSFADTPAAAWADPPLTTVRQDLLEKGRRTGELVLRLLQGRGPGEPVTIGVALVTGASSGPPPQTRLVR